MGKVKTGGTAARPAAGASAEKPKAEDLKCGKLPCDDCGRAVSRAVVRSARRRAAISVGLALMHIVERGITGFAEDIERELAEAEKSAQAAERRAKTDGKRRVPAKGGAKSGEKKPVAAKRPAKSGAKPSAASAD